MRSALPTLPPDQPGELQGVDAAVVGGIVGLDGIEPDEVHAAVVEGVVVGAQVVVVHAAVVERMRGGHAGAAGDDAEEVVVAGHGVVWCAQLHFPHEQLEVTAGTRLLLARRVANQVAGQQREGRVDGIGDGDEPTGPTDNAGIDVRVGGVDEAERSRLPSAGRRPNQTTFPGLTGCTDDVAHSQARDVKILNFNHDAGPLGRPAGVSRE